MTDAERLAYAGSDEAFEGTRCLTCQKRQGAELSRKSTEYAKKYGLSETTIEEQPSGQQPPQQAPAKPNDD
jgi:hypothetical protein